MLPLISFLALSSSFAAASARKSLEHNLSERDTCSCQSSTASIFASSDAVTTSANKATTPQGYVNTATNSQSWTDGDGCLGFVDIDDYDSSVCAALCDSITECSTFQICQFNQQVGLTWLLTDTRFRTGWRSEVPSQVFLLGWCSLLPGW